MPGLSSSNALIVTLPPSIMASRWSWHLLSAHYVQALNMDYFIYSPQQYYYHFTDEAQSIELTCMPSHIYKK